MAQISDLQKGLVGHWTMNSEDVDNGKIRDRSAYDNHGTLNGGVSNGGYAPSGFALEFDGNDDNVDLGDPSLFNEITDEFSVSVWFKTSSTGDQVILNNANYNDDTGWQIRTDSGDRIQLEYYDTSNGNTQPDSNAGNLTNGQWHHFVVTFDANNEFVYYVDGKYDLNGSSNEILDNDNINTRIGAMEISGHDRRFNGKISDVRVYNRALSQSEINQLYNQRTTRAHKMQKVPVAQQDLVAHYPFASEGATDQSGNGYDGTNNGATYIDDGGVNANGAYDFNGSEDEISINKSVFDVNSSFTLSGWFLVRGGRGGMAKHDGSGNYMYFGPGNSTVFAFVLSDGSNSIGPIHTYNSNWTHYAGVYSQTNEKLILYADGILQDQKDVSSLGAVSNHDFALGRRAPNDGYGGKISDARVYDRPLSKYEVKRLYQSEGAVFGGIEKGYKSSDLTFYANQWDGSGNTGEVDITGSQFTKRNGEVVDITPIDNGVALQEGGSVSGVEGYIMYSEQSVFDRFNDNPPISGNGTHLIGVRKNGETWEYDDNGSFHEFSPRPTDHLIAEVGWGVDFVNGLNIYS